jgi:hypothetical protein
MSTLRKSQTLERAKTSRPVLGAYNASPLSAVSTNDTAPSTPYIKSRPSSRETAQNSSRGEISWLRQELQTTKEMLIQAQTQHQNDIKMLKSQISDLQRELELARFERDEQNIQNSNHIAQIPYFADQLINLRTEIDRLSTMLYKRKRDRYSMDTSRLGIICSKANLLP